MKLVCNRHGSGTVLHDQDTVCPLCTAYKDQHGLIQLLLNTGALPELPEEHYWHIYRGGLRVLGPDWGHCAKTCTHDPFANVTLPVVDFGYTLRKKQETP